MRSEAKQLGVVDGRILSRAARTGCPTFGAVLSRQRWNTTKANPSFSAQHKSGVPHPCDGILSQGWDTTNANPHRSFKTHLIHSGISNRLCQLLTVVLLTAPTLRAQQPPITPTPAASN